MAREVQVTFDCGDPARLAEFWAVALSGAVQPPPAEFASWDEALAAWGVPEERRNDRSAVVDPDGAGPRLFFQRVPEGRTAKNRVHLDVRGAPGLEGPQRMAALEELADTLMALGGSRVHRFDPGGPGGMDAGHLVMTDPEGNEFCLD